jgi:hypothetical protein
VTVYRLNMTVWNDGMEPEKVTVEVDAPTEEEAISRLPNAGIRVNEHGATYASPLATDVRGGTVYHQWTINDVKPSKAKVTTEAAARQLQEMRDKVQDGPEHGVNRDDAVALLDGMTAEQVREVAARGPLPAGYQQRNKADLVRYTVDTQVGSALNHRAIVGYPEKDIAPEWTGDAAKKRREKMLAELSENGREPEKPDATAVKWVDPQTGSVHVGVIRNRTKTTADVEWDNGRVEKGVKFNDTKVEFLSAEDGDTIRAEHEAAERAAARDKANTENAERGGHFPHNHDHYTPDPFGADVDRKRATEAAMREKIRELQGQPGSGYYVGLKDLREAMPDLSKEEFDEVADKVFSHTDVFANPQRAGSGTKEEQLEAGVAFGPGMHSVHILNPEEARLQRGDDPQRWKSSDRDTAESYFATLSEAELSNLARRLDLDAEGSAEELRERLADNAATNHREEGIRVHEETEDLIALADAEKAMDKGNHPGTWTDEERARVGAAARRQHDNKWGPGQERARLFEGLPEDGTLGEKWTEYGQNQDEIKAAKKEAAENGQAYIDHVMEGTEPCAAGRRHPGPCLSGHVTPEHFCTLCGGDVDLVDMTTTAGGHLCRRCIADRAAYNGQPHDDWTGVPGWVGQKCSRCGKPMDLVKGSQHFDADGGASISTRCPRCKIQSGVEWVWSTGTSPAEDENVCEECGQWPGHSQFCPLNGEAHNVLRTAKADDGVTVQLVRDEHGYAVQDTVCGHVTSEAAEDRDSADGDFDHHVGWHNAEHAREANRGKADDSSQIERTTTADDGVVISLVRTASAAGAESGQYVVQCDGHGQVTTGPLEDAERMNSAFDNHVKLHNFKKAEADAKPPVQPYAGTKAELELKYDDVVRLHEDMITKLDARQEKAEKGSYEIEQCRARVEDVEAHDGSLRDAAATLMAEMEKARFDTASIAGVEGAATAVDPDSIAELIDAVDITSDTMTGHFDRTNEVIDELHQSLQYVDQTYGALAAGVQETGVSGQVLDGKAA